MKYKGFETVDTAEPYFELMYLPFDRNAVKPNFKACVKQPQAMKHGFTLYYTNQCHFTAKYVPILKGIAKTHGAEMEVVHIVSTEQAQNSPSPFTIFSLYYNGKFITHELQSEKKFEKILAERGL